MALVAKQTRQGGLDSYVCVYTSAIDLLDAARGRVCPAQERIEMRFEGQNSRTRGRGEWRRADERRDNGRERREEEITQWQAHNTTEHRQTGRVLFLPAKQQQYKTRQVETRQYKARETVRLANRLFFFSSSSCCCCCCCCCSGYSCGYST